MFQNELKANPLVSRVISGKRYFAFQAVVTSNPKSNDFIDSNYTHNEIANLCSFREGLAVRFELKSTKRPINFFHCDFFDSMDTFQIWGTHSIERLALIQASFYKNATGGVGAVVSTFIDELEGDVTLSTMLVGYYQKHKAVERLKLQHAGSPTWIKPFLRRMGCQPMSPFPTTGLFLTFPMTGTQDSNPQLNELGNALMPILM